MMTSTIDNIPLYNSRIIDTYIKFIKRNYSYINVGELLNYAKMKSYQVTDEGHWFTQEQINLFYERLVKLTGNKNISREAGRYAASPDSIGVMRLYVLGLVGPAKAYEIAGKYAHNFTKSSIYKSKEIDANKIEITVTPLADTSEKPHQCENRMGFFEAVALMFKYRLPQIEHPECLFKGGSVCRYVISWKESPTFFWKRIRNYTAVFFLAAGLGSYFMYPWATLLTFLPCSSFAISLIKPHNFAKLM